MIRKRRKKLLEESGWTDTDGDGYADKDGKKLSITWLTYPTRLEQPKLAEYAQSTLKDIGIEVNVNNTADHATYAKNGEFDVYVSSLTTAPTGDPEYFSQVRLYLTLPRIMVNTAMLRWMIS